MRYHVDAKRYLCAVEADYYATLSPASVTTLNLQGGLMSDSEVAKFQALENLDAITAVRRWDDQAKVIGVKTPPFSHYQPLLESAIA